MEHELAFDLAKILGFDLVEKCWQIAGSTPVSFGAILKECRNEQMKKLINEKKSNSFIAGKVGVSSRTVKRYRKGLDVEN